MSSTFAPTSSAPFTRCHFDNDGVDYALSVAPTGDTFRVVVRRRADGLFVKEWLNQSAEDVERLRKRLAKDQRIVFLYDLDDMRVLDFAEQYVAAYGESPLYRVIAAQIHMSYTEVARCLERLEQKGFVRRSFLNKDGFKILRFRNSL